MPVSQFTTDALKNFKEKYGVLPNIDDLFDNLKDLQEICAKISAVKSGDIRLDPQVKNNLISEASELFKETYRYALQDVLKERFKIEGGAAFDEKCNVADMIREFDSLMTDVIYKETTVPKFMPCDRLAYGDMSEKDLRELLGSLPLPQKRDDILKDISGKSANEIRADFSRDYLDNEVVSYPDLVSAAQAIRQKNVNRGRLGRFFHPIESHREKKILKDLAAVADKRFCNRNFNSDLHTMNCPNEYSKEIDAKFNDILNDVSALRKDGREYAAKKWKELDAKFKNGRVEPEAAREAAEKKYKEKLLPRFKSAYDKNKGDISSLKEELGDDYRLYGQRFLNEMKEAENVQAPVPNEFSENKLKKDSQIVPEPDPNAEPEGVLNIDAEIEKRGVSIDFLSKQK